MQLAAAAAALTAADDLPGGRYARVKVNGQAERPRGWGMYRCVLANHRAWLLALMYGLSFGVELTVGAAPPPLLVQGKHCCACCLAGPSHAAAAPAQPLPGAPAKHLCKQRATWHTAAPTRGGADAARRRWTTSSCSTCSTTSTSTSRCGGAALHPCTPAALHPCTPAPLHPCTPAPLHPCTPAPLPPCTPAPLHPCTPAPLPYRPALPQDSACARPCPANAPAPRQVAGALGGVFGLMNLFTRAAGGYASDWAAQRYGMRGRLWALYAAQAGAGAACLLAGLSGHSLGATVASMVVFSVFVQAACGCTFGVVPFISNRSVGLLTGLVAAGGNALSGGGAAALHHAGHTLLQMQRRPPRPLARLAGAGPPSRPTPPLTPHANPPSRPMPTPPHAPPPHRPRHHAVRLLHAHRP
jgi:hypothetical protein